MLEVWQFHDNGAHIRMTEVLKTKSSRSILTGHPGYGWIRFLS